MGAVDTVCVMGKLTMKQLLLFLLLSVGSFAQNKENTEFFRQFGKGRDTIYFMGEAIGEHRIKEMKKMVEKGYLTGTINPLPKTTPKGHPLTLTAQEKQFLLAELDKEASANRKQYLSANRNYILIDTFDHAKHKCYSNYTKPIFFRNNTLCLIYTEGICGPLNGGGGWKVYRKEKGTWNQWLTMTGWIS
jgi:hypothetical protein